MSVSGIMLSSNAAVINTGVNDRMDVDLSYIGQYGNQSVASGVTGGVKFRF